MSLKEKFEAAMAESKNLPERPDNMTLLKIYALFKQGSSADDAMQQYIDLIESLK